MSRQGQVTFEAALAALALGDEPVASLVALGEHAAALSLPDGSHLLCHQYFEEHHEAIAEHLKGVAGSLRAGRLVLVVIGGDERVRLMLKAAQPFWMIRKRVEVMQLQDDGTLWTGPNTSSVGPVARRLRRPAGEPPPDQGELRARLEQAVDPSADRSREVIAFGRSLRARRAPASWVLFGMCGLMMLGEVLWGGADFVPTLVRMGANVFDRVAAGEWERLVACMFLHGGLEHFAGNMFVLIYLGRFVERLLGTPRFLVLYGLAGITGGAASAVLSDGLLSVGASGALWGILGASAALAFRPAGLVPGPVQLRLKRAAVLNLGLNLMLSFLPQVDMWAHLGGGLAGIVLVGSGLLTRGLMAERSASGRTALAWIPAGLVAAVLLAAPAWAVVGGRPWELAGPLRWQRVQLGEGVSMEVPSLVADAARRIERPAGHEIVFGELLRDAIVIGVVLGPGAGGNEWEQIRAMREASIPAGLTRRGALEEIEVDGLATLHDVLEAPGGIVMHRYLQRRPAISVSLELVLWPRLPPGLRFEPRRLIGALADQQPDSG